MSAQPIFHRVQLVKIGFEIMQSNPNKYVREYPALEGASAGKEGAVSSECDPDNKSAWEMRGRWVSRCLFSAASRTRFSRHVTPWWLLWLPVWSSSSGLSTRRGRRGLVVSGTIPGDDDRVVAVAPPKLCSPIRPVQAPVPAGHSETPRSWSWLGSRAELEEGWNGLES